MRRDRVSNNFKKIFIFLFIVFASKFLCGESQVLFSPKDKISEKLIAKINNATKRIYVAIYMLTDRRIATALADAKNNRSVDVQIVTDQSCLESEYGKIDFLKEKGIDVFIFKPNVRRNRKYAKLMHNKFALFDNKVWTGSFNWTISANTKNHENVIFTDEEYVCKKYEKQFEKLKRKCIRQSFAPKKTARTKKFEQIKNDCQKSYQSLKDKTVNFLKSIKDKFSKK